MHPSQSEIVRTKIDDFLMAHDTTCVDAIDKDGMMFSATPSGAWLPSVIAGDTGIPLTERAQSFLLVPGNPNELAGGKRPRVTLSPTLVTHTDGTPWMRAFHARRRQPGAGADAGAVQCRAVPDERRAGDRSAALPDAASGFELRQSRDESGRSAAGRAHSAGGDAGTGERGHKIGTRSRWNSGAAPGAGSGDARAACSKPGRIRGATGSMRAW